MASIRTRRMRNLLLAIACSGLGLWMSGTSLWQLIQTAIFVHESVVVTGTVIDVRQKPFESWNDTLGKGNWSWPGDVSYQPIVRFTLPGGIDAIRLDFAADNVDYHTGQEISIISPPDKPGKAHINRWKFIWGASCLRLGVGSFLAIIGYALIKRLKGSAPAKAAKPAKTTQAEPERRPARKSSGGRKTGERSASSTPRRRKRAESSANNSTEAPRKPRRPRKKKAETQQGELPF